MQMGKFSEKLPLNTTLNNSKCARDDIEKNEFKPELNSNRLFLKVQLVDFPSLTRCVLNLHLVILKLSKVTLTPFPL